MQKTWTLELRADFMDPKFNDIITEHFMDAADRIEAIINLGSNNEEQMRMKFKMWTEDTVIGIQEIRDRRKRGEGNKVAQALDQQKTMGLAPLGNSAGDLDLSALHTDDPPK